MTTTATATDITQTGTGRFLTFRIGDEYYATDVSNLERVLEVVPIMHVPGMPGFVRGVINMMGRVVPVIDLRLRLGMEETQKSVDTCVIVFEFSANGKRNTVGALADAVDEVIELNAEMIEPAPRIGMSNDHKYVAGIAKHGDRFLMILDFNALFASDEPPLPDKPGNAETETLGAL